MFLGITVFYTVPTQAPFWLSEITGTGPVVVGVLMAALNLVMTVVGLNFRRLRARWDFPVLAAAIFAAYAGGLIVLGLTGGIWMAAIGMLIIGIGVGLQNPVING